MDFNFVGGNEMGTDEIYSSTPMNYDASDIFMTQHKINTQLKWPAPTHTYPNPQMARKISLPPRQSESFVVDKYGGYPQLTENMLIILLLVILIIMCTMIYSTVKQTCETIKVLTSLLAAQ